MTMITNQFFCMTFWLMMMHYHTNFGYKVFGSLEDIWTFNDILCDLYLERSNPTFSQDTPAYHNVPANNDTLLCVNTPQ